MTFFLTVVLVAQTAFVPLYRITRTPVSAVAPNWDHAEQVIPLTEWACDRDPATPLAARTARMTDPARPTRVCEWTAPVGAWLLTEGGNGHYFGTYRYELAVQTEDGGSWSNPVASGVSAGTSTAPQRFIIRPE